MERERDTVTPKYQKQASEVGSLKSRRHKTPLLLCFVQLSAKRMINENRCSRNAKCFIPNTIITAINIWRATSRLEAETPCRSLLLPTVGSASMALG